jgi:hypothetical protein
MDKLKLRELLLEQQEIFNSMSNLIERDVNLDYFLKGEEVVIISGIRRCGKSSLLKLISSKLNLTSVYINFDDVRFTDFKLENYQDIEEIILELYGNEVIFYLDEIQNLPYWEKWVNGLYFKKYKVFVTGSNSNLLSSEISTFLTGRNKVLKLNPFSFKEYLKLNLIEYNLDVLPISVKTKIKQLFNSYFELGGFPQILKNNDILLSKQYFEDILNKDVISRYKIREQKELKDLMVFLFSNSGKIYSYSTLKSISGIKSLSTIKNYIDYFQNSFLIYSINRFDYYLKKQKISSNKVYLADNSFFKTISFNFSENFGKRMENLVFIELKRRNLGIYYHSSDKAECDFVIKEGLDIVSAIQVTKSLSDIETKKRELKGLLEAMKTYNLKEGLILTEDEEGVETYEGKKINIKPIWKWLLK